MSVALWFFIFMEQLQMAPKYVGIKLLPLFIFMATAAVALAADSPSSSAKYSTEELPIERKLRPDERKTLFIGNYGESIVFSDRWVLHPPTLNHGIEVVRFHSSWYKDSPAPRKIPDSAFGQPSNFAALELAQLLVIPEEHEDIRDLTKLQAAKLAELTAEHVVFTTRAAPSPVSDWPKDTFQVLTTKPYRLHQVYARSNGNVFILTSALGSDAAGSYLGTPGADDIVSSLGASLERANRAPETPRKETFDYSFSGSRWICLPMLAAGLILWGISGKTGILRRLSAGAITSSVLSVLLRIAGFYVARDLTPSHLSAESAVLLIGGGLTAGLLLFLLYRSTQLQGALKWGVRGISLASALVLALAMIVTKQDVAGNPQDAASKFSLFMFCLGLVDGACLGFSWSASDNPNGLKAALSLLFLLLLPGRAAAQETTDAERSEAARNVDSRDDPIQSDEYRARAIHQLDAEGALFNYQRVEISGIVATDDPNDFAPRMIDLPIHPAHNSSVVDKPASGLLQRIRKSMKEFDNDRKDISDLFDDKTGKLTPRGREILAPLLDKATHVNEIVAHSWGAVLLNNAIRMGLVNPPKRIIVIGVPDSDLLKWHQLTKYTGTNVEVYSSSWDMAQMVAHKADTFKNLELAGRQEDYNQGKIAREWAQWSQGNRRRTNADSTMQIGYVDIPPAPWTAFGHGREQYYNALMKKGIISKTIDDLLNDQEELIESRIRDLREEAIDREVQEIRRSRQQPTREDSHTSDSAAEPAEVEDTRSTPIAAPAPLAPAPLPPQPAPAERAPQDLQPLVNAAQWACREPNQSAMPAAVYYYDALPAADTVSAQLTGCEKYVFDQTVRAIRANRLNGYLSPDYERSLAAQMQPTQTPPINQGGQRRRGEERERRERVDPCKRAYPEYCNE